MLLLFVLLWRGGAASLGWRGEQEGTGDGCPWENGDGLEMLQNHNISAWFFRWGHAPSHPRFTVPRVTGDGADVCAGDTSLNARAVAVLL